MNALNSTRTGEVNFYSNSGYGNIQTKVGKIVNLHEHIKGEALMQTEKSVTDQGNESEFIDSQHENIDELSANNKVNRITADTFNSAKFKTNEKTKRNFIPLIVVGLILLLSAGVALTMYFESINSQKPQVKKQVAAMAIGTGSEKNAEADAQSIGLSGSIQNFEGLEATADGAHDISTSQVAESVGNDAEVNAAKQLLANFDTPQVASKDIKTENYTTNSLGTISEIRIENLESLARGTSDLAHGIAPKVNSLEEKVNAQQVHIESFQRAIAQTAQLMVSTQTKLSAVQVEVKSMKRKIDETDERINALTEKIDMLQPSRTTSNNAVAPTKKNLDVKNVVVDAPIKPKMVEVASTEKVVITQLRVLALNGNRAVVKSNTDEKQFVIEAGQSYKNLGTVSSMSASENKIYGKFENGREWVIGAGI